MKYRGFALCHEGAGTSHAEAIHNLLDLVELADGLGLDGWFFPEHHGLPEHSLSTSPHLLIAAASQRTTTMRLGSMVDLVSFQHPLRVAEEIRFLDALTHGRLDVGVGPGGFNEHVHWGIDPAEGAQAFEAAVTLLRRFLTEDRFEYRTRWWTGRAPVLAPDAVQEPHPPLWLAAGLEQSVDTAAGWGLHCQVAMCRRDVLATRVAQYRRRWAASNPGKPPGQVAALVELVVSGDGDAARHAGEQAHRRRLERLHRVFAARPGRFVRSEERRGRDEAVEALSYSELIDQGLVVCGDVDECTDQLVRMAGTGVDAVTAWVPFGDVDMGWARRSLELFCEAVVPGVESALARM